MAKCKYCDSAATGYTMPPMCEAHEEIAMLIEYLREKKIEITGNALVGLAEKCRANNGSLTIANEDILTLYPRMIDEMPETISYAEVTPQ